jgi:hypothetical protein
MAPLEKYKVEREKVIFENREISDAEEEDDNSYDSEEIEIATESVND